jgi:hypothetical protein
MKNRVVEFERDRKIAWSPIRHDEEGEDWQIRWGYELEPEGADATMVTETFDCSRAPEHAMEILKEGETWRAGMEKSLEQLQAKASAAP